ncbi:hypothetical protein [Lysobacter auxotrophicus]|uniref:Uncharacterized protein n=1 Tax=Lysobacter auxotrophicus TaxID=2992573 RepID=A0ABN6UMI8_9GAMM|nr:hypothetical protein [Lysobacter auxotrophicus]BDU17569.1 hypothetical protein LA521A_27700 [Lysobacter auxotrophicus]
MDLLLEIEDRFALAGQGLALTPDLSRPHSEDGESYSVLVERPDGSSLTAKARVRLVHFRLVGYKLVLFLAESHEDEIPVGSKVWKL